MSDALQEAREQADEHGGFARSGTAKAHKTGEEFTFPSLRLLDDDQQAAYNRLVHKLNQCDRYPDTVVPERTVKSTDPDGTVTETTVAAQTVRGDFIEPYQKDGELIEPPYDVQITQILLGEEDYKRFKDGGGRSSEVRQTLLDMNREYQERLRNDSKSS